MKMDKNRTIKGMEKSLFIIDILLCSIWGLFMFSTWAFYVGALLVPVLLIVVRLWVSFMIYKRVGYGLYTATCFAVLLIGYEHRDIVFGIPIIRMVDYACMVIGGAAPRLFLADYYYTPDKEMGQMIANIGYMWLAGYPILFGLYSLLKIRSIKFRLMPGWKTIVKYVVVVSLYAYFYEFFREPASPPDWWVWTLMMSFVPIITEWHAYKESSESFTPIWKDRMVGYYGLLSLIILTAFLIGRENPGYLGSVGVMALSVLLLYVVLKSDGISLQTRDVLILVFGTFAYWLAQFFDNELKIALLVINLCCIAYVCLLKGLNWKTLLFVPIAIIVFIQPFCIGNNLYTATDVGMRGKYRYYDKAIKGLWLVDCGKDKLGLRDRYGMILDADYEDIQHMQRSKPYVKVKKNGKWGVYDLEQRRMEIPPTYTDIVQKGKYTFLLADEQNPQNNKYLTMYVHYYRYQAKIWKFYELSDTIPEQPLAFDWSQFEDYINNR